MPARGCQQIGCVARNRLSAAAAYGDVAFGRLDRMGLSQKQGTRALSNVLVRRMSPALRTYDSVARKLESTISAVTRTTALLNTQVSIEIERQQELLVSVGTVLSIVTLTITVVQTLSSLSPIVCGWPPASYMCMYLCAYLCQLLSCPFHLRGHLHWYDALRAYGSTQGPAPSEVQHELTRVAT
eukprot:scaffold3311_cov411-Prasinococcus_capsulatus_cf.AAC.11